MSLREHSRLRGRNASLSLCIAAALAVAAPSAVSAATTWTVNSCDSDNTGSGTTGTLRYAAKMAVSGDTIDMTALTCASISLNTGAVRGAVSLPQTDLTIKGPGKDKLAITGKYGTSIEPDRVINHTGTGTLTIDDVSLEFGSLTTSSANALGGCLYSAGNVTATNVGIYACSAGTTSGLASGGGIYAKGGLRLKYSVVFDNNADAGNGGFSRGGGAATPGTFYTKYSTISENSATSTKPRIQGNGGGLSVGGGTTIIASTISNNSSSNNQGGINIYSNKPAGLKASITNSTITGNTATNFTGGIYVNSGTVEIDNSTIALNSAGVERTGNTPPRYYAPGLAIGDSTGAVAVTLQSTLIANNVSGTSDEYDLSVPNRSSTTVTFSGANNLVRATFAAVPADTIRLSCPLLGPLRDNGGFTETLALLSHSPGIDQGNNNANLKQDQRGSYTASAPYPYPRSSGAAPDIGAYELQQDDIIFDTSFEGCPILM